MLRQFVSYWTPVSLALPRSHSFWPPSPPSPLSPSPPLLSLPPPCIACRQSSGIDQVKPPPSVVICPTLKPDASARNSLDGQRPAAGSGAWGHSGVFTTPVRAPASDSSASTSGVFGNGAEGSGVYGGGATGARTPLIIPSGSGMCDAEASFMAMSPSPMPASLQTPAGTSVLSLALAQTKAKPRLR